MMTASDCMGGKCGTPVNDRTLDLLIDHLRDVYLPTILARIADRSEPYIVHIFAHILQTWHVYRLYVLVFCIRWL